MSKADLNVAAYASISAFLSGSATAVKNYALTGQSIASRIFAACAIERIRMPSASLEKVIDTAFAGLKIDVMEAATVKVYRSNVTTALRHLATTGEFPQVGSGEPEAVILAKVQTLITTYSLRGLVKAASEARAPKVAAKAEATQKAKVDAAEATHQANRSAREAMGVKADCALDVLALVNAVNAFIEADKGGNAEAGMVIDQLVARLEMHRAERATNVATLAIAA